MGGLFAFEYITFAIQNVGGGAAYEKNNYSVINVVLMFGLLFDVADIYAFAGDFPSY